MVSTILRIRKARKIVMAKYLNHEPLTVTNQEYYYMPLLSSIDVGVVKIRPENLKLLKIEKEKLWSR